MWKLLHILQLPWTEAIHYWMPALPYLALLLALTSLLTLITVVRLAVQRRQTRRRTKPRPALPAPMRRGLDRIRPELFSLQYCPPKSLPDAPTHQPLPPGARLANDAVLPAQLLPLTPDRTSVPNPRPAPRPRFDLHKRALAVRLLEQGEATANIASILHLSSPEIDLLVRIQRIPRTQEMGRSSTFSRNAFAPPAGPVAPGATRPASMGFGKSEKTSPLDDSAVDVKAEPADIALPRFPRLVSPAPAVRQFAAQSRIPGVLGSVRRRRVAILA